MTDVRESVDGDEDGQLAHIDAEAKRWVAALTFTGLLMTILFIAGLYVAMTAHAVNQGCFQRKMNDEHTLLEASFQAPPEQDAAVEAVRACSH
jgi:hypothetical protein